MKLGIILVHGYSGSTQNLQPLADMLKQDFGPGSVDNLCLPGHERSFQGEKVPEFDEDTFIKSISDSFYIYQNEGRKVIVIGHSTGGSLVLAALQKFALIPDLLILLAVPRQINKSYFKRWELHQTGKKTVSMVDVALMVKLINKVGQIRFRNQFPTLIIHGENDQLVLCEETQSWSENFPRIPRTVTFPEVEHDIFHSTNGHLVADLIRRAVTDIAISGDHDSKALYSIVKVEPGLKRFFEVATYCRTHITLCPSGQRVLENQPEPIPIAKTDPVIANIEITTYCNLNCQFCARSELNKKNRHMSFQSFRNILALLPNTYKIVLVGLGEPLLHPEIIKFIIYTKSQGRKVGIVTNAMLLTPDVSLQLLEAGLDSIAFSIDGYNDIVSSQVREGTDFKKVIQNIKEFVRIADSTPKTPLYSVSKAVFSAVSIDTVAHFNDLIDCVSDLGADVLMLSDINFKANLKHTLWQNVSPEIEETVRKGVSYAFSKNLPVLSVHGLEEFGLEKRYQDFLMIPPAQLYHRSPSHRWCFSPWQTIPVGVEGNITLCDCQPNFIVGNLLKNNFSEIWNGKVLQKYRTEMISQDPPEACKICPRF